MKQFEIYVNGQPVPATPGQTIAEAMLANGLRTCRNTRSHSPRGVFCGMGICYECRMIVDGIPNVRTCMTPATPGSRIRVQDDGVIEMDP
ncbi:MAG: (2Fe-2S)-binding protein [Deltaproteobacteria bacterium]|nr:(2Fe-2S)-binding protein [Deltaproteobacteria bacterium]